MNGKFLILCLLVTSLEAVHVFAEERETFLSDFRLNNGTYKPLGFRVRKIHPGSIYDRIGLMDGDIIKKLNQRPIINSTEAHAVLVELKTLNRIELVVQRNGREIALHYDAKNLKRQNRQLATEIQER